MAIFAGMRRKKVVKVNLIRLKVIKKSKKIAVGIKYTGKPLNHNKPTISDIRKSSKFIMNEAKVKGSSVVKLTERALTKAERKKMQKLTPQQRKARRQKIYRRLEKLLASKNPLNLKLGKVIR